LSRLTRVACLGGLIGVMRSSVGVYYKDGHMWGLGIIKMGVVSSTLELILN